jgi:hypothetical protein
MNHMNNQSHIHDFDFLLGSLDIRNRRRTKEACECGVEHSTMKKSKEFPVRQERQQSPRVMRDLGLFQ